jgi:hypothetical protein
VRRAGAFLAALVLAMFPVACGGEDSSSVRSPTTPDFEGGRGIRVSPSSFDYGPVDIGVSSKSALFTATNIGREPTGPIGVRLEADEASEFDLVASGCAMSLDPGQTCPMVVAFTPRFAGSKLARLTVTFGPHSRFFSVLLMGLAVPGRGDGGAGDAGTGDGGPAETTLTVSPAELSFDNTPVGLDSAPARVVVTNASPAFRSGDLRLSLDGSNPHEFHIVGSTCEDRPLVPGESCEVLVLFRPVIVGSKTARLHVSARPGGVVTVNLAAQSQRPSGLELLPTFFEFPGVPVPPPGGPAPAPAVTSFVVLNPGSERRGPLAPDFSGPDGDDFDLGPTDCASLEAQASCILTVRFAPRTVGRKTASLEIAVPGFPPVVARLSGLGR